MLLMGVALFALFVPVLTRLPIRRLQAVLEWPRSGSTPDIARARQVIRYTDLVCYRARRLIPSKCLARSITLYFFLRLCGVKTSLVFGIGTSDEKGNATSAFPGHCWLVRDGEPYLEDDDPRLFFTPMYAFEASTKHV